MNRIMLEESESTSKNLSHVRRIGLTFIIRKIMRDKDENQVKGYYFGIEMLTIISIMLRAERTYCILFNFS
jgi:hypothetical protein